MALSPWGKRYGSKAGELNLRFIEDSIGGPSLTQQGKTTPPTLLIGPHLEGSTGIPRTWIPAPHTITAEEESVLSYLALSVGPLGKDISSVVGHLNPISYFHRVKTGINPISLMPRVSLMIRGLRRANGPVTRKLPFSIEDPKTLNDMIEHDDIDQQVLWATVLMGWFFMMRMGEHLENNDQNRPASRHPLRMSGIDPLYKGNLTHCGSHVDEIMLHIWIKNGLAQSRVHSVTLEGLQ